jgi:hypothetical protein
MKFQNVPKTFLHFLHFTVNDITSIYSKFKLYLLEQNI